jgi:hypothetical protein
MRCRTIRSAVRAGTTAMTSFVKVIATLYSKAGGGRRYACSGRQVGMKNRLLALSLILVLPLVLALRTAGQSPFRPASAPSGKPRVVLTHDPELDDVNTMIRALLYTTDFRLEGLVYASGTFHFKGDGQGTTQE